MGFPKTCIFSKNCDSYACITIFSFWQARKPLTCNAHKVYVSRTKLRFIKVCIAPLTRFTCNHLLASCLTRRECGPCLAHALRSKASERGTRDIAEGLRSKLSRSEAIPCLRQISPRVASP